MKTFNILPITLFFLFNSCVTPSKRMSEKDFNRIIVLGQAPLEILLELGFKEKIVGVAYLDAPEVLEDHSEIPLMSIGWTDKESVLSLKPDLIFALESAFRSDKIGDVEFWESRGIRVCIIDNYKEDKNLENYKIDLTKTGALFGIENKTDSIIHHFSNINQKYHQRRTHASKRILHLSYTGTASKYYYYPPTMCLVDEIIRNCGGEYINLGSNYFILPMETIIQSDPDKIVITWFRRQNGVNLIEQLYANPHFKHLKAVKNRQVIEIDYTQAIRGTLNMEPTYLSISNFLKL